MNYYYLCDVRAIPSQENMLLCGSDCSAKNKEKVIIELEKRNGTIREEKYNAALVKSLEHLSS